MEKDKALPVLTRLSRDEIAALKKQEDKKQALNSAPLHRLALGDPVAPASVAFLNPFLFWGGQCCRSAFCCGLSSGALLLAGKEMPALHCTALHRTAPRRPRHPGPCACQSGVAEALAPPDIFTAD